MISFKSKTNFTKTLNRLKRYQEISVDDILRKYGEMGVKALAAATPKRTGMTAESWGYKIVHKGNGVSLIWTNSNAPYGVPVAILIQYGHATRGGGYVEGIDYINPALRPVFDDILRHIDGEVRTR